jgi:hypothetical protein
MNMHITITNRRHAGTPTRTMHTHQPVGDNNTMEEGNGVSS